MRQTPGLVARYMHKSRRKLPGAVARRDRLPPRAAHAMYATYQNATEKIHLRTKSEVERLFAGLEMVSPFADAEPGVTFVGKWGAEDACAADTDGSRGLYCGVARRP